MKNILCFGDSNTWGYEPGTGQRYPVHIRWTGVLQSELGNEFRVIEEGLNGRTTNLDEPGRPDRNGAKFLPALLESHAPLDLVVIMLGTNDLKSFFHRSAQDIAQGAKKVCGLVLDCEFLDPGMTTTLLISPALVDNHGGGDLMELEGAVEKSQEFAEHFQQAAIELGVYFEDAAQAVQVSVLDGVHWDAEGHLRFGEKLADIVREISDTP